MSSSDAFSDDEDWLIQNNSQLRAHFRSVKEFQRKVAEDRLQRQKEKKAEELKEQLRKDQEQLKLMKQLEELEEL